GALIVREHQELVFISQTGMVQRTVASGISLMGRSTQGVRVMNLKSGDRVSAVALVVESANGNGNAPTPELPRPDGAAAADVPAEAEVIDGADGANGAGGAKPKPTRKRSAASKAAPKTQSKPKAAPNANATGKAKNGSKR